MRAAVVHIDHEEQARTLAEWLDADIVRYSRDSLAQAFLEREVIVAVMAAGIVVRELATLVRDKWVDPAVVVVTPDMRFCVPVLGGHHGGNRTAMDLSAHGVTPVISTATDALGRDSVEGIADRHGLEVVNKSSTVAVNRAFLHEDVPVYRIDGPAVVIISSPVSILSPKGEYVVGIGCNRGTEASEIKEAVGEALRTAGICGDDVLAYTSTVKKADEAGLLSAVQEIGGRLFLVDDEAINAQPVTSRSRAELIGLVGVAEPSALALARRKEIVMKRRSYGNVTVAIAR